MQGVRWGLLPPFPAQRRDRRLVQAEVLREGILPETEGPGRNSGERAGGVGACPGTGSCECPLVFDLEPPYVRQQEAPLAVASMSNSRRSRLYVPHLLAVHAGDGQRPPESTIGKPHRRSAQHPISPDLDRLSRMPDPGFVAKVPACCKSPTAAPSPAVLLKRPEHPIPLGDGRCIHRHQILFALHQPFVTDFRSQLVDVQLV